jgi:hypothetical protein
MDHPPGDFMSAFLTTQIYSGFVALLPNIRFQEALFTGPLVVKVG